MARGTLKLFSKASLIHFDKALESSDATTHDAPQAHWLETSFQLTIRRPQVFRDDARLADGGHEVGVARPAREDVHMEMIGDAGAGGLAEVDAEVEAVWMIDLFQHGVSASGKVEHLVGGLFRQV